MTTQYSQNGYVACDPDLIAKYTIPGTSVTVNLRKGDTSVVLLDYAAWHAANIEILSQTDTGGYNCRNVRGSSKTLSNHASGTAVDLRWNRHPQGKRNAGFTQDQIDRIHARLRTYGGVVRWGNDYTGTPDAMHFEINAGPAAVKTVADRIREDTMALSAADKTWISDQINAAVKMGKQSDGTPTSPAGNAILSQGIPDGLDPKGGRKTAWQVIQRIGQSLARIEAALTKLTAGQ